jgi:hypothetical protein
VSVGQAQRVSGGHCVRIWQCPYFGAKFRPIDEIEGADMAKAGHRFMVFLVAMMGYGSPAFGQAAVGKPELYVGDEWTFRETGDDAGTNVDRRWRRRIVEKLPDETIRVEPVYGGVRNFDASWNPRLPTRPSGSVWFRFPLHVGATWSYESAPGAMTSSNLSYKEDGQFKVVAIESITIPAGTYDCFRIEGRTHWLGHAGTHAPEGAYAEWSRVTHWYCPDFRYFAKRRIERNTRSAYGKATRSVLESTLIAFTSGSPSPTPSVPASDSPLPPTTAPPS